MNTRTLRRCALLCGLCLALVACGTHTRVAVMNDTQHAVTVELKASDGSLVVTDLAPGSTSAFQKLGFEIMAGVAVTVSGGGMGGTLDLTKTHDNVVVISDTAAPVTRSQANPDNSYW